MIRTICLSMILALPAPALMAQGDDRPGAAWPKYDPATELQFTAKVQTVQDGACGPGTQGLHLFLKNDEREYAVHVGPAWFLKQKGFSVGEGDTLTITGSQVSCQGVEVIQPREMVKDGKTIVLRDEKGLPMWAGQGKGQGKGRGKGPGRRPSGQD